MEAVFLKLLNMSITAGWLVLAVVAFRFVFKKAPKALHVILWALVGVRLICPFSFESVLSLVPSTETVPQDIMYSDAPTIHTGIPMMNSTINPIISESLAPNVGDSVNPMQVIVAVASYVWIFGMIAMVLYTFFSYHSIHKKVREAIPIRENVWMCDHVDTPFILGVFRPQIYLPSDMSEEDVTYVLAHENAHLKRHDHWWKPLGFALLTVYWFNPLLWLAYVLLCRDIELACDEKVIRELGVENKKPYSEALINCSIPRKMISACPLAFGEVGVKARVKTVLNYKKPAFWIILLAVVACVIVAVCFLTNPKDDSDTNRDEPYVLKSGEYYAKAPNSGPYIFLDAEHKTFVTGAHSSMSSARIGSYEFDGRELILTVERYDSSISDIYVLRLNQNGNFVYDADASTIVLEMQWLEDGMEFEKEESGVSVTTSQYTNVDLGPEYLSKEDAKTITDILEKLSWVKNDVYKTMCDFIFEIDDKYYSYSMQEGIINDYENNKCKKLSEKNRLIVNDIISKYLYPDTTQMIGKEWFNYYRNGSEEFNSKKQVELSELPDITFTYQAGNVLISDDKGVVKEFGGMAEICANGYFYDLTGDKVPELCMTMQIGSGMIDTRIVVYDCVKGKTYQLADRCHFDYSLHIINGELVVNKSLYMTEQIVEQGGLAIRKNSSSGEPELLIVPTNSFKENYVLKSGNYLAGMSEVTPPTSSDSLLSPYINIDTERKGFMTGECMLMSYAKFGTYEFDGSILTLKVGGEDENSDIYVLYLNQYGGFVYDEAASTLVSESQWFKNGMVFSLVSY